MNTFSLLLVNEFNLIKDSKLYIHIVENIYDFNI